MPFSLVDQITDPGYPDGSKPNEDWLGFDGRVGIVADGATGLWDQRLLETGQSDAQAVAKLIVERFLAGRADDSARDLVRETVEHLQSLVSGHESGIPRYGWPSSGFVAIRDQGGILEVSGLGDCTAVVQLTDGSVEVFTALPGNRSGEIRSAREQLSKRSESGEPIRSLAVVEELRRKRERANTEESGVWTVSLEPLAADHVMTVALPSSEVETVLLMSDGFSSLTDNYEGGDHGWLLERAVKTGLAAINAEIRRIERLVDPNAERFARFKQSDDSSAILLRRL